MKRYNSDMEKRLLNILRCPVSRKVLTLLKKDKLAEVNTAISAGTIVNHDGEKVAAPLSEALITDDGKRIYPINDGIPVLLESEAIGMEQLA
ncbi:MAG: Trm112 family protein [Pseudomonadota bacterium]